MTASTMATRSSISAAGRSLPNAVPWTRARPHLRTSRRGLRRCRAARRDASCRPRNAGTRERAHDEPGAELRRHLPAWRGRQLVVHEFADAGEAQDPRRPMIAEEGEPSVGEIQEAERGRPTRGGWSQQGARTGHEAGEKGGEQHRRTTCFGRAPPRSDRPRKAGGSVAAHIRRIVGRSSGWRGDAARPPNEKARCAESKSGSVPCRHASTGARFVGADEITTDRISCQ